MRSHDFRLLRYGEDVFTCVGMKAFDEVGAYLARLHGRVKRVDHSYPDADLHIARDVRFGGAGSEEQLEAVEYRLHLRFYKFDLNVLHGTRLSFKKETPEFRVRELRRQVVSMVVLPAKRSEDREPHNHPEDDRDHRAPIGFLFIDAADAAMTCEHLQAPSHGSQEAGRECDSAHHQRRRDRCAGDEKDQGGADHTPDKSCYVFDAVAVVTDREGLNPADGFTVERRRAEKCHDECESVREPLYGRHEDRPARLLVLSHK